MNVRNFDLVKGTLFVDAAVMVDRRDAADSEGAAELLRRDHRRVGLGAAPRSRIATDGSTCSGVLTPTPRSSRERLHASGAGSSGASFRPSDTRGDGAPVWCAQRLPNAAAWSRANSAMPRASIPLRSFTAEVTRDSQPREYAVK